MDTIARLFALRNRLVASPGFRSKIQKIPIIQLFARRRARQLFSLCTGFVHSQVLVACIRSGLIAALAGGERTPAELAQETGLSRERIARLLRAAAALDICQAVAGGRYMLGENGAALCGNDGLLAMIAHHDALYSDLGDPLTLLDEDAAPGELQNYWAYARDAQSDDIGSDDVSPYSTLMASSQTLVTEQILGAIDLRKHSRVLDVGGGNGSFAIALVRRWPHLNVTIVDLPAVADLAEKNVRDAGLQERIATVGLDFNTAPLPGGHDVVTLVRILHDHDEAQVRALLQAIAVAIVPGGELIVAEPLADGGATGRLLDAYFSMYFLAMGQGDLRRLGHLKGLLKSAGFVSVGRLRTDMPLITSVVHARRHVKT